jgi:hypothetical protein
MRTALRLGVAVSDHPKAVPARVINFLWRMVIVRALVLLALIPASLLLAFLAAKMAPAGEKFE